MAKSFDNSIFDSGLNTVINAAAAGTLRLVLNSQAPATRAEAATLYDGTAGKYRLTDEVSVASGDVSIADRTGGGREITVAAKSGTAAATIAAGSDLHYSLYDGTTLLYVSDETSDQALTSGNPVNFPSFKFGFSDPV
jgi:hypothetical protein